MPFLGRTPDIGAIADDVVTSAKIADDAVVAAAIADDACLLYTSPSPRD